MNYWKSYSTCKGRQELTFTLKVKYCHEIFRVGPVRESCARLLREAAALHGIEIVEMGFDPTKPNHVHLIIKIPPKMSVADAAKALKGYSGYKLLKQFGWLKRRYFWGSGLWNAGYFFDSVGQDEARAVTYARTQGKGQTSSEPQSFAQPATPITQQPQTLLAGFL